MSIAIVPMQQSHMAVNQGGNLKKQLRDTLRLLSRPNLPADIRLEKERKLQALNHLLQEKGQAEKEKKMTKAYRMVRFFEQKKAERRVKQTQASGIGLEDALMDLNYVLHFPRDRKYIALFPSTETTEEAVLEERRCIRKDINDDLVAKAKVSSILEAPLPEMMHSTSQLEEQELKVRSAYTAEANKRGRAANSDDEDDEEDDEDEDDDGEGGYNDDNDDDDEGTETDDVDDDDGTCGEDDNDSDDSDDTEPSGGGEGYSGEDSSDIDDDDDELIEDDDEDDDEEDDDLGSEDDESDDDEEEEDDDEEEEEAPASKRSRH